MKKYITTRIKRHSHNLLSKMGVAVVRKKRTVFPLVDDMLRTIFSHSAFITKPLILLDIGASGGIHEKWKTIAPFSIVVGFDADDRELAETNKHAQFCKKLIMVNSIVADSSSEAADFYLTSSPFCSSMLAPNKQALQDWSFAQLFNVEKVIKLKVESLTSVLKVNNLDYVDWIKVDSQGIDLRLVRSLPDSIFKTISALEFEPGFMDAYQGEDKALDVLNYMTSKPFWLTRLFVKGAERVNFDQIKHFFSEQEMQAFRYGHSILENAPGWADIGYLRNLDDDMDLRSLLVLIGFALIMKQEGHAFQIITNGQKKFEDPIFQLLRDNLIKNWKTKINH